MRLVPETNNGKVDFYRAHIETWLANADAIGLSGGRAATLQAILIEAEAALRDQRLAQQAAHTATQRANHALETLSRYGAGALGSIRAAAVEGGDEVFELAMIPAPSRSRTTLGPPTTPGGFNAELINPGWLKLTWKCRSPKGAGGTVYRVSRQLNGTGPYEELELTGKKVFIDKTIPPGTTSARYQVRPRRSTCEGQSGFHTVNLAANYELPEFEADKQAA